MSQLTDPWSAPSALPAYSPTAETNLFNHEPLGQDRHPEEAPALGWDSYNGQTEETENTRSAAELDASAKRVHVTLEGELSGQWARKYHTYLVTFEGISVSRRFSDFDKLETYLLAVYPFRLLPPLPGKRLVISGYYALADSQFPSRRAQGLARYSSALLSHPVLQKDDLVQSFFRDPQPPSAELYKIASTTEEAMRPERKLSPDQEASVPAILEETLEHLKKGRLAEMLKAWISIYHSFEQSCRREEAQALEYSAWSANLLHAAVLDEGLSGDRQKLRHDLSIASEALSRRPNLLRSMQSDVLTERFKAHVEMYQSMAELLQRHQKLSSDAVDRLRRRIATSQTKIDKYKREQKPQSWETSVRKLEESTASDNAQIEALLSRRTFIRYAMQQELAHFSQQTTRFSVTLSTLANAQREYSESLSENVWSQLSNALE